MSSPIEDTEVKKSKPSVARKKKKKIEWGEGLYRWTAFQAEHASGVVPPDYPDKALISWVRDMQREYWKNRLFKKSLFLDDHGFDMLSRRGFDWGPNPFTDEEWEARKTKAPGRTRHHHHGSSSGQKRKGASTLSPLQASVSAAKKPRTSAQKPPGLKPPPQSSASLKSPPAGKAVVSASSTKPAPLNTAKSTAAIAAKRTSATKSSPSTTSTASVSTGTVGTPGAASDIRHPKNTYAKISTAVRMIDTTTNETVNVFYSIRQGERESGVDRKSIRTALETGKASGSGKYRWEYINKPASRKAFEAARSSPGIPAASSKKSKSSTSTSAAVASTPAALVSRPKKKGQPVSKQEEEDEVFLLSMTPIQNWPNTPVRILFGPYEGHVGHVEKWNNGWVGIRIPEIGLHHRRSNELLLENGNDNGEIYRKAAAPSPSATSKIKRKVPDSKATGNALVSKNDANGIDLVGKRVTAVHGPHAGHTGKVERWSNGWVAVNFPKLGSSNCRLNHLVLEQKKGTGSISLADIDASAFARPKHTDMEGKEMIGKAVKMLFSPHKGLVGKAVSWNFGWLAVRLPKVGVKNFRLNDLVLNDEKDKTPSGSAKSQRPNKEVKTKSNLGSVSKAEVKLAAASPKAKSNKKSETAGGMLVGAHVRVIGGKHEGHSGEAVKWANGWMGINLPGIGIQYCRMKDIEVSDGKDVSY